MLDPICFDGWTCNERSSLPKGHLRAGPHSSSAATLGQKSRKSSNPADLGTAPAPKIGQFSKFEGHVQAQLPGARGASGGRPEASGTTGSCTRRPLKACSSAGSLMMTKGFACKDFIEDGLLDFTKLPPAKKWSDKWWQQDPGMTGSNNGNDVSNNNNNNNSNNKNDNNNNNHSNNNNLTNNSSNNPARRLSDLAQPRRQRLVQDTLEIVRSNNFNPSQGLEAAARMAASEVAAAEAALIKQEALSAMLSMPQCPWREGKLRGTGDGAGDGGAELGGAAGDGQAINVRTKAEQEEVCQLLAQPRKRPKPEQPAKGPRRTVQEQQRECLRLAKAKVREPLMLDLDADGTNWKQELATRSAEPASEVVEAARSHLERMLRAQASSSSSSQQQQQQQQQHQQNQPSSSSSLLLGLTSACSSRPGTGQHKKKVIGAGVGVPLESLSDELQSQVRDLRTLVEELLWVVLLQKRSCPKPPAKSSTSASASASSTSAAKAAKAAAAQERQREVRAAKDGLLERLEHLLLGAVGPALRPLVRHLLAPGTRLARQVRVEFPRLAAHLGMRESEELEVHLPAWTEDDVQHHVDAVRACRDELLSSELTKLLVSCGGPTR